MHISSIRYVIFSPKKLSNQSLQTLYSYNSHHMYVDIRKRGKKALVSTKTIVHNLTPKIFYFKNANNESMISLARGQKRTPDITCSGQVCSLDMLENYQKKKKNFQMQFMEANGISGCLVPKSQDTDTMMNYKVTNHCLPHPRIKQITLKKYILNIVTFITIVTSIQQRAHNKCKSGNIY